MYKQFFRLTSDPFNLTPDPRFYFSNPVHQGMYEKLLQLAQQRGDYLALIGEPGTGKTTLLKRLMEKVNSSFYCVYFEYTNFSFEAFLTAILNKLGIEAQEDTCTARFDLFIAEMAHQKRSLLLLLDEAQNIPRDSLEQLLSHLDRLRYQGRMIEVVMAGQPELQGKLDAPAFSANSRCFVARYQLSSLNIEDTGKFIFHRLNMSGCRDPDLISAQAIGVIGKFTQGNPRLINMVCDRILVTACERAVKRVDEMLAEEVIAALKEHDPEGFLRFYQNRLPPEAPAKTTARSSSAIPTIKATRQAGRRRYLAYMISRFRELTRSVVAAVKSWTRCYRDSWIAGSTAAILLVIGLFLFSPADRRVSDMLNSAQATEGQDAVVAAQRREITQLEDMQLTLNTRLNEAVKQQAQLMREVERLQREVAENKASNANIDSLTQVYLHGNDQLPLLEQDLVGNLETPSVLQKAVLKRHAEDLVFQPEEKAQAIAANRGVITQASADTAMSSMSEVNPEIEIRQPETVAMVAQLSAVNVDGVAPEVSQASISNETEAEQAYDTQELTALVMMLPFATGDTLQASEEPALISVEADSGLEVDRSELPEAEQTPPFFTDGMITDSIGPAAKTDADGSGADAIEKRKEKPPETSFEVSEVDDLLAEAALLVQAKYLTTPTDRNALRLYQRVLELAVDHPEAIAGIEKIVRQYSEWGDHALDAGDRLRARSYYSKGLLADPGNIALHQKLKSLQQLEPRVAAGGNRDQARKYLEARGISVSKAELLASAERGDLAVTQLLLDAGVSANARQSDGWTALLFAAVHGYTDVARLLLANGANPNIKNSNGETALTAASWNGHAELVDILLDAGARVNERNGEGWTPLMGAALNGHLAVVKRLLAQDARTDISDSNGWNALMAATREGHEKIAVLLKQAKKT